MSRSVLRAPGTLLVLVVAVVAGSVVVAGCTTEPPLADGVVVRCADDSECPAGLRCSVDPGRADRAATCRAPGCGDGVLDGGEACDDGVDNSDERADACRTDCRIPTCGDGVIDSGERCELDDTTCRPDCTRCGDGVIDAGEFCDDGASNSDVDADACRTDCTVAFCGDGVIDSGESCDLDHDDCRSDCSFCGDGVIDAGEVCDDGAANNDFAPDACRREDCQLPSCGDGVKDTGEACDDGADNSDVDVDACRTTCVKPRCGDAVKDTGERCDDGNNESGDGCVADCNKEEVCGDGFVDDAGDGLRPFDEACDDKNDIPVDGCRDCQIQTFAPEVVVGAPITDESGALSLVGHVAVATEGGCEGCTRLFVTAAFDHRVYRVDLLGSEVKSFVTIAGTGEPGSDGDGGPATLARLNAPLGVAFDARRNRIYVADSNNGLIRVIEADGTIGTLAGRLGATLADNAVESQEGRVAAADAILIFPTGLELAPDGDLLIAEEGGFRIREVDIDRGDDLGDGHVTLIAGCPFAHDSDGCDRLPGFIEGHCIPSTRVACSDASPCPGGGTFACVDVDVGSHDDGLEEKTCVVRSSGPPDCPPPNSRNLGGGPVTFTFRDAPTRAATGVRLAPLNDVAVGPDGTIYWNEATTGRILFRRGNEIRTLAGSSRVNQGFSGDGGDARAARLAFPINVLVRGNELLVLEFLNHIVRRIDLDTGIIGTAAGTPPTPVTSGRCGPFDEFFVDGFGGPCATAQPGTDSARLTGPVAIALERSGDLIVAERTATQVRRIDLDTAPATISAPLLGGPRVEPDTLGPATSVDKLVSPGSIAFDPAGRLHFFEWNASMATGIGPGPSLQVGQVTTRALLLRVNDDGIVERVAGGGTGGDGLALDARLDAPTDLTFVGDEAVFVDRGALRRLRAGVLSTVALPAPLTGVFSAAVEASGAIVAVDDTLFRVLRIGTDDSVTILSDRSADSGASFYYETMATPGGVVHVMDLIDTSGGNFTTFDIDLLRVDTAGGLAPITFDTSTLADDIDIETFTVTGLIDEVVSGGVELTMVRHAAHEIRRYRADGSSERVAGNGREPCQPRDVDDGGISGPECDNTGDGLSSSAEFDPPAGHIAAADAPLRLSLRINVTFPGVADLDPRNDVPQLSARQQVLQQASIARHPGGGLVIGEQPMTALGVRPGVVSAPFFQNAARLRRLADGRLRTVVGPIHPPGPGEVAGDAALYNARALAVLPDGRVLAGGEEGRLQLIGDDVTVVAGGGDVEDEVPGSTPAADLALPGAITGLALHDDLLLVVGYEQAGPDTQVRCPVGIPGSGSMVVIALDDPLDPSTWRLVQRVTGQARLCGVAAAPEPGRFYVSSTDEHCVKSWRVGDVGLGATSVAGTCNEVGRFGDFLNTPGSVVARGDFLFVGDLGNDRIVRVRGEDPRTAVVIAGEDAVTDVDFRVTPGQLAFDAWDTLYVPTGTVVRQLLGVLADTPTGEGEGEGEGEEEDPIRAITGRTIYGQDRSAFPELSSFCLAGLATHTADDTVVISDACQGFLVRLLP